MILTSNWPRDLILPFVWLRDLVLASDWLRDLILASDWPRDLILTPDWLQGLHPLLEWRALHVAGGGGATALARHGADTLATGGQDGRINLLSAGTRDPVKVGEPRYCAVIGRLLQY